MPNFGSRIVALGAAALALWLAAPACAQNNLGGFMPPAPEGWQATETHFTEDPNGMEPFASRIYAPAKPGSSSGFSITFTRPGPADLASYFDDKRLGPNPFMPEMVTSLVKVDSLDAWLTWNESVRGGVLEMKVGRVQIGILASEVSREQLLAFGRSIDVARLLKY